jgi:hypothetical protein
MLSGYTTRQYVLRDEFSFSEGEDLYNLMKGIDNLRITEKTKADNGGFFFKASYRGLQLEIDYLEGEVSLLAHSDNSFSRIRDLEKEIGVKFVEVEND